MLRAPSRGTPPSSPAGGGSEPTKILIESAGTPYPLHGLTGHIEIPAPPAGKAYQDIVFDVIGAISEGDTTPTAAGDLSQYCHSYGRYIIDGANSTSWYRCLDFQGTWYAGLEDDVDAAGSLIVGVIPRSTWGLAYVLRYSPATRRLVIADSGVPGTAGQTGTRLAREDPPVIESILVTGNTVRGT